MSKRASIIVVAVLVILVAVGAVVWKIRQNQKQAVQPFAVEKKELDSLQLPQGFPKNLPIEAGSTIVQNYEATTPDGRRQSTRVFTTSKSLKDAVEVYDDFFFLEGWMRIPASATQDTGLVSALLRRKDDVLLITGRTAASSNQKTVELTLTEAKVQK